MHRLHSLAEKKIHGVKALIFFSVISLLLLFITVQQSHYYSFSPLLYTRMYPSNFSTKEITVNTGQWRTRQPYLDCQNFTIKLYGDNTFNLTALVSYPGSGNTWLRHLIELATGIFTGSIYYDLELYGKGFLGENEEWNSGSTIVQKSHMKYSKSQFSFSRAIILIRDPYQAIISFVQYLESGHIGRASQSTFYNKGWPTYVLSQTFSWISLVKSWLESPAELMVVHYENVLKNPKHELQRICNFLLVKCPNVNRTCFQKHMNGAFHRKTKLKPKVHFLGWVRDKVDDGIDYLSSLLVQYGHDPLPVKLYKFYRNPKLVDP